jgi:hypothetical protein
MVASVIVAISITAGCADDARESIELPPQNIAQWSLPLDRFMPVNSTAADYAENLLMTPCMREAGYAWEVPWRDVSADRGATWNDVGRRLFNVEVAGEFGYHLAQSDDAGLGAWREFTSQPVSDAMAADIVTCRDEVRIDLPRLDPNVQLANGLAAVARDDALTESDVASAASRWRECMLDAGIADLPRSPEAMPTETMSVTFDLADPESLPTPDEIRLAVKDATCREDSGYTAALYQREWDHQVDELGDNADALLELEAVIDANRRDVLDAVSAHAPARP